MFDELQKVFSGELYYNNSTPHQAVVLSYATDASVYQEKPAAVALPKTVADIKTLIQFASKNNCTLIPRAAGTSLAGQVVGSGVVVDISKHFTGIRRLEVYAAFDPPAPQPAPGAGEMIPFPTGFPALNPPAHRFFPPVLCHAQDSAAAKNSSTRYETVHFPRHACSHLSEFTIVFRLCLIIPS